MSRLRAFLAGAGYSEQAVRDLLRVDDTLLRRYDRPLYRRRLGDDPISSLIRLFLLGDVVGGALDPSGLEGLLEPGAGGIRSTVAIQPWRDLLVPHDWPGSIREDHVVGISEITSLLADLTVRRPVATVLDVGTGSGIQALLAAGHADRVVGVDLNPRALLLAGWTLALHGTENVDLRGGSWFEPVEGESFDLVVSNLPFIVSPDERWLYRDGGPGGTISQKVVEEAPRFLREGGFAHILCQWPLGPGEPWDAKPRRWTEASGCDVWLLRVAPDADLVDYASSWNEQLRPTDEAGFEQALDRWLGYFAAEGVDRIAFGVVNLRRRSGSTWVRCDEVAEWPAEPAGAHVERIFDGQTLVDSLSDAELLEAVLEPASGLRLDETRAYGDEGYELVAAQPRLPRRLAVRPRLSPRALEVVSQLDGRRMLRGLDAADALPHLRELVALGFLEVRGDRAAA